MKINLDALNQAQQQRVCQHSELVIEQVSHTHSLHTVHTTAAAEEKQIELIAHQIKLLHHHTDW